MRRNHFFVQKTAIWGENVTVLHGQLYLEKSTAWNRVTNWIKCQTGCQYLFLWLIKTSIRRELEGKVICTQDQTRITTYHTSHQFLRCVGLNNSEVCQETLIFLPQSCRWSLGMWVRLKCIIAWSWAVMIQLLLPLKECIMTDFWSTVSAVKD